jgi:predicted nuclease of restriction endonuclease-like (RecB) superfamily
MNIEKITSTDYQDLLSQISTTFLRGQNHVARAINSAILETYWLIGQYIVEFEQAGKSKATYGDKLLQNLSKDLTLANGKGFSRPNLNNMRMLYLNYPICQTLSDKLSWSHYIELVKIDNVNERQFYENQAVHENWGIRELRRQIDTSLYLRLATSKDAKGILEMHKKGSIIEHPIDIIKDTYVLEFLKIPEHHQLSEKELETRLIDNLQTFLLELGKGFTFVGRQYRISLDNAHYKIDLVFYHRILRCFVLIDLKINEVKHQDIGQMNMYMGYFAEEENTEGDNPPIGIILTRKKNELVVKYATYGMNSQLFVSKYQLYLPNEEELRLQLERILNEE